MRQTYPGARWNHGPGVTPGEEVAIRTPAQQRHGGGNQTINMTVVTQDAQSFQRSRGQIQADLAFAVAGARRYS